MHTQQSVTENDLAISQAVFPLHRLTSPAHHDPPIKIFAKKHDGDQTARSRLAPKSEKPTLFCRDGHKTLAGGIAHNFNNLLMGMNGYVELMLLNPEADHFADLKRIKANIFFGSSRIKGFLAYARSKLNGRTGPVSKGTICRKTFTCAYETSGKKPSPPDASGQVGSLTLEAAADVIVEDLTRILSDIRFGTKAIMDRIASDHPHRESLRKIDRLVSKGKEMTAQLIQCSRNARLEKKAVRLESLVNEAMDAFCANKERVAVHQKFSQDLWEVMADSCQIEQIVQNMYINAQDAMPGGGDFFVEATNAGIYASHEDTTEGGGRKYILLTFRDTGTGMDEQTAGRIFEPFFSTKGLKGRGLGLSSVYGIVRAHGGRIEVDSAPGRGTAFMIYLPAACQDHEAKERFVAAG